MNLMGCRVWCPVSRSLVHLHELPGGDIAQSRLHVPRAVPADGALDFLGPVKPNDICADIAEGRIDPLTHKRFVVLSVNGVTHVVLEGEEPANMQVSPGLSAPAPLGVVLNVPLQPCQTHAGAGARQQWPHHAAPARGTVPAQLAQPLSSAPQAVLARTSAPATLAAYRPPRTDSRDVTTSHKQTSASAAGHSSGLFGAASKGDSSVESDCSMRAQLNGQPLAEPANQCATGGARASGQRLGASASIGVKERTCSAGGWSSAAGTDRLQGQIAGAVDQARRASASDVQLPTSISDSKRSNAPAVARFGALRNRLAALIAPKATTQPSAQGADADKAREASSSAPQAPLADMHAPSGAQAAEPAPATQCSASEAPTGIWRFASKSKRSGCTGSEFTEGRAQRCAPRGLGPVCVGHAEQLSEGFAKSGRGSRTVAIFSRCSVGPAAKALGMRQGRARCVAVT